MSAIRKDTMKIVRLISQSKDDRKVELIEVMNKNEWLRVTLLIQKLDDAIVNLEALQGDALEAYIIDEVVPTLTKVNEYLGDRKRDIA